MLIFFLWDSLDRSPTTTTPINRMACRTMREGFHDSVVIERRGVSPTGLVVCLAGGPMISPGAGRGVSAEIAWLLCGERMAYAHAREHVLRGRE